MIRQEAYKPSMADDGMLAISNRAKKVVICDGVCLKMGRLYHIYIIISMQTVEYVK